MLWLYVFPIFIFCSSVFYACVTTPGSDRQQLILMSENQMHSMGNQAYAEMQTKQKISNNKQLTAKVVEIGKNIAKASGAGFNWEFTLFDSDQVNAFCLPGGKIGVYTGIIPIAKTNAGLAAILGHEVAHATARHGNERVSQQLLVSGSLIALNVALKDNKKRNLIMAGIGLGAQFGVLMPYSRRQESEADSIGLRFMAKAGYELKEAPELWKRMAALGKTPPEWLSTHPDPLKRSKALSKEIDSVRNLYEKSLKKKTVAL
jgi:predicted Zn-dependent protease